MSEAATPTVPKRDLQFRMRPGAWLVVAAVAMIVALGAVLTAYAVLRSAPPRYRAEAQVALLPGRQVPPAEVANYWEALSRGQAGRIAAEVLGQRRWLAPAAKSAGADVKSLSVTAGVVADTSLINVAAEANSPRMAEDAVTAVIREARPVVEQVAGQFAVEIVQPAEGGAVQIGSSRSQVLAVVWVVGLLIGGGLGLLTVRLWESRKSAHRATPAGTPSDDSWRVMVHRPRPTAAVEPAAERSTPVVNDQASPRPMPSPQPRSEAVADHHTAAGPPTGTEQPTASQHPSTAGP